MGDKKLLQVVEYLVQYNCRNCDFEWSKYWLYAHIYEDCPRCDMKSVQGTLEEIKREKEDIKFLELNITIRAGLIDDISSGLYRATEEFLRGDKIGSWCGKTSNYEFKLSEK